MNAIFEVVTEHFPSVSPVSGRIDCDPGTEDCPMWSDEHAWCQHVAPLLAERLERAQLGPAALAADERIAAAIRAAGFHKPQQ